MKVVVTELIWPQGLEELKNSASVTYDPDLWKNVEALRKLVTSADALIVRNQTRVSGELLAESSVKAVGRLGAGLDNIDLTYTRQYKIPVVYARNANAVSVAEYVVAAIFHASRDIAAANRSVREGRWDRREFTGQEVYAKCLGLIGVGEIGQRVARRAKDLGMQVIGYDPYLAPYDYPVAETGIEPVGLEGLLTSADFVSVHVPLNEQTRGLMSLEFFRIMKPTAHVINTSRGGVVVEADLARALEEGLISGAFLDVLEEEPPSPASPLLKQERAVLTPHVAGLTEESQVRTSRLVASEVIRVLNGQPSLCVVE